MANSLQSGSPSTSVRLGPNVALANNATQATLSSPAALTQAVPPTNLPAVQSAGRTVESLSLARRSVEG